MTAGLPTRFLFRVTGLPAIPTPCPVARGGRLATLLGVMALGLSGCLSGGGSSGDGAASAAASVPGSPTITGTPPSQAVVDAQYSFTPVGSDPDGDPVSFVVDNLPAWASFDPDTGRIAGTPSVADTGLYADIVIGVTDGAATASLPPFSIEVQQNGQGVASLSWTAPTTNADGSPLLDLQGYVIYYGTQSGQYPNSVAVDNAGLNTFVVTNLAPGTYFFAVVAVDADGNQSDFSNEVQAAVG